DAEFGKNDIAYEPPMGKPLNKAQLDTLYREGLANAGFPPATIDFVMNDIFGFNTDANYDWLALVTHKGLQQQVNVSASGGDPRTQFYLSGGYFRQQSPVIGSNLTRYSTNFNVRHEISQK